MRLAFVVRFKKNGKASTFKTYASSPKAAAQRCKGGRVVSVRKASVKPSGAIKL